MTKDDLIREMLQRVCNYGRDIQGKTFKMNYNYPKGELGKTLFSMARNDMAKAIIFQIHWKKFQTFLKTCHDTWTPEEEDKGIEILDYLTKICDSAAETWELFWQGKQPDNPKKMPFICMIDGKEQLNIVDLTMIEEITIGNLGIK